MIEFKLSSDDFGLITEKLSFTNFESSKIQFQSVHCTVTREQARCLLDKLGDELVANGLNEASEPTGYGRHIETLIDIVNGSLQEG